MDPECGCSLYWLHGKCSHVETKGIAMTVDKWVAGIEVLKAQGAFLHFDQWLKIVSTSERGVCARPLADAPQWSIPAPAPSARADAQISWADLRAAARQPDVDLAAAYAEILHAAERQEAARHERIAAEQQRAAQRRVSACPGHRAECAGPDYGYSGPVSVHDQNRAAHGGITYTERCRCGGKREVNANGRHVEYGPWGVARG
jgi:hypothetical protein